MKQLLIFFLMFACVLLIDMKPLLFDEKENDTIQVTIKGAVSKQETLSLPLYTTAEDALSKVELNENADISVFNPQQILKDKDVLIIPEKKEEEEKRISINSASSEELCKLPGIGESTANRIIAYRNEYGFFQKIEDIMNVKGIGSAKFEKIKDLIAL